MAYKDKKDPRARASRRRWYNKNKKRQLSKQKERKDFKRSFLKRWKSLQCCRDCGISFKGQEYLCDLHHIDDKKGVITALLSYGMKTLKDEIRKCVPLCSNCHRHRHKADIYSSA